MSRETKFRAWDEVGKQWLYLTLSDLITNQLERQGYSNLRVTNWCICTGLKDKSGKEIYEGDIIQYEKPLTFDNGESGTWNGGVREVKDIYTLQFPRNDAKHTEVIGNIYENPELINGL